MLGYKFCVLVKIMPMPYQDFLTDKQAFSSTSLTTETIKALAESQSCRFLSNNKALIQQEYNHLFESLQNMSGLHPDLWLRCAYYCHLLYCYHRARDEQYKAEDYQHKMDAIYQAIGNTNMLRINYAFSRVTVKQALLFANNSQWVSDDVDITDMLSVIDYPTPLFNALSVGLLACRLSINISQIIKHTFYPASDDGTLTPYERFCQEVYDRQYHLLNDIVWGTVNLFCNYNTFFNLSDLFAGQLTSIFLVFDALWLVWSRHLIEEAYLTKKAQYLEEKNAVKTQMDELCKAGGVFNSYQLSILVGESDLLDQQLYELEKEWQGNNAEYLFSISAAAVFTTGFTSTLILAAPAAIVFNYFMCTIAVAMYLSAGEYADYQKKSYVLDLDATPDHQEALDEARNAFIFAMIKNTVMPLFITTCFAICWPAALAGTIIYVSNALLPKNDPEPVDKKAVAANDDDGSSDDDDEGSNRRLVAS